MVLCPPFPNKEQDTGPIILVIIILQKIRYTADEDPLINVNDLAFLLVTHDFDGMPKGDYVEVRLNNTIYKLVPNGPYPGLANVTIES